MTREARILPFGDEALLVELGDDIDMATTDRVVRLVESVDARRTGMPGIGRPVPAYTTILVPFMPDLRDAGEVTTLIEACMVDITEAEGNRTPPASAIVEIPVRYGGSDGADLEDVAARTGLSPREVVETHASVIYRVHMLGFAPGFAYLGALPERLRLPRRDEPRIRVPAGSVAIAAAQTAVYPFSTPGGWHLLGRTDVLMWDRSAERPARLAPGNRVRFVAV